jgi:hypothetical protein
MPGERARFANLSDQAKVWISHCGLCPLSGHAALEFAQPNSSI